jgi:hypothetical protein
MLSVMSQTSAAWKQPFTELFNHSVEKYRQGHEKAPGLVDAKSRDFLKSIGYTEQEFFDFVEDFSRGGEPTLDTALEVAAVRRDYFLNEQKGVFSDHRISMDDLPSKEAQVEGIPWLPRILPKAESKLRGEMPPDLMYGCGGDRRFFKNHDLDPAEFLREVWQAKGDHAKVIAWVKEKSRD